MDGVWTFLIPQSNGGGIIIAHNGKLYGGDIGYFLAGSYTSDGIAVQGLLDASLFNSSGVSASIWGDKAPAFKLTFTGKRSGDTISGQIQRVGKPKGMPVKLIRRADLP